MSLLFPRSVCVCMGVCVRRACVGAYPTSIIIYGVSEDAWVPVLPDELTFRWLKPDVI